MHREANTDLNLALWQFAISLILNMASPGWLWILKKCNIHRKSRNWFWEMSVLKNGLGQILFYFVFSVTIARHVYMLHCFIIFDFYFIPAVDCLIWLSSVTSRHIKLSSKCFEDFSFLWLFTYIYVSCHSEICVE